jgi:hypothetical protein
MKWIPQTIGDVADQMGTSINCMIWSLGEWLATEEDGTRLSV